MRPALGASLFLLAATGCGESTTPEQTEPAPLSCRVQVDGVGLVDVEGDYIPKVVACEHGDAEPEAMKAQAVAARTYLFFYLEDHESIPSGQQTQVYGCEREPSDAHRAAASDTRGQILEYEGDPIAAFYVSGAIPSAADCVATTSDPDPHGTEHFVTYNSGRQSSEVLQSSLGMIDPDNAKNRGAMSQNGSDCLSKQGYDYQEILRFYYGNDIQISTRRKTCGDAT